jgi:hypothetical protein
MVDVSVVMCVAQQESLRDVLGLVQAGRMHECARLQK